MAALVPLRQQDVSGIPSRASRSVTVLHTISSVFLSSGCMRQISSDMTSSRPRMEISQKLVGTNQPTNQL